MAHEFSQFLHSYFRGCRVSSRRNKALCKFSWGELSWMVADPQKPQKLKRIGYAHMQKCMHTYMQAHTYTHTSFTHAYTHTHIHTATHHEERVHQEGGSEKRHPHKASKELVRQFTKSKEVVFSVEVKPAGEDKRKAMHTVTHKVEVCHTTHVITVPKTVQRYKGVPSDGTILC